MNKNISILAIIAAFSLIFAACDPDGDSQNNSNGVDFTSHTTSYSILVTNNTGKRLIVFKGDLQADKLVGGIPAHAQNHGLPNDPAMFDKTEAFLMILLTEAQYNENKDNLNLLRNIPFSRIFVLFNKTGDNPAVYEIAAGLGGNNRLIVLNPSILLNVELRVGGITGPILGCAPAGILQTTIMLQDGHYDVFPVFIRNDNITDIFETIYPNDGNGLTVQFGEGCNEVTMNLTNLLKEVLWASYE